MSFECILGGMGFIIWVDLFQYLTGQSQKIHFTTKLIAVVTFAFLAFGMLVMYFILGDGNESWHHRLLVAFFQTMSASTTAGFDVVPGNSIPNAGLILLMFLMTFGASPSGTGGGLKSASFAALIGHVKSTLEGRDYTTIWRHKLSTKRMQIASSTFVFYMGVLALSLFIYSMIEPSFSFHELLFEAVTALTTCGLSIGITPDLSYAGKMLTIFLMFMGRIGVLTFGLAISMSRYQRSRHDEIVVE